MRMCFCNWKVSSLRYKETFMEYDLTLFEKGLEELGIALSEDQKKQFITYYEYLVEKNKVMNLTAITEYDEIVYLS